MTAQINKKIIMNLKGTQFEHNNNNQSLIIYVKLLKSFFLSKREYTFAFNA